MTQNSHLYRLVEPAPQLTNDEGRGPVLIHGLEGFSDAGHAVQATTEYLRENFDPQLVAEFNADELIDFRSRRPALHYSFDRFTGYEEPKIEMHSLTDANGRNFLLLSGLEPDMKWDGFTNAVIDIAESFGVDMAIGLGTAPLSVPHTRPTQSSAHSNDVDLIRGFTAWPGEFDIPGSADSLLELRMGEHGHPSVGFTVHTPHYLAQNRYPAAALRLVGDIAEVSGLVMPTDELEQATEEFSKQISVQIAGNDEIQGAVSEMEKRFDEFMESHRGADSLNPGGTPLPSGEEIGAQFEQFLAEWSDEDPEGGQDSVN